MTHLTCMPVTAVPLKSTGMRSGWRWERAAARRSRLVIGMAGLLGSPKITDFGAAFAIRRCLMNVPFLYSRKAVRNSSWVFMTMGPCQATGSPRGRPEMRRKRTGESVVATLTRPPSPKRMTAWSPWTGLRSRSK